jgi:hypothetical protein
VLIEPANRQAEVFFTDACGARWLTDQAGAAELTLTSIGCKRPIAVVFNGMRVEAAQWPLA